MKNTRGVQEIQRYPKPGEGKCQTEATGMTKGFQKFLDRYLSEESDTPLVGGRIIIVGSAAVGKSCLMKRYFQGDFSDNYRVTIGVDFGQKELTIFGIEYRVQVFDTAGEEKFRSLSEQYYRNADCVLVCFDLGDMETLAESRRWANEAKEFSRNDNVKVILVGCKADKLKVCEKEDVELVWEDIGGEYFETSALSDQNVDEVFNRASYIVFENVLKRFYKRKEKNENEEVNKKKKKKGGGGGSNNTGDSGDGFKLNEKKPSSSGGGGGKGCGGCG